MIRLRAEVGMRRDEISRVHSDDIIELIAGWGIIIQGKERKQRTLTLPEDLAALIKDSNGYVFPGRFGGHASASYVGKHISQLLPDGWSGHKLRHRWTGRGYEKTGDIYLVSAGLGHASVDTTMHYVPMPLDRMHELTEATRLKTVR
jgi:integrase